MDKHLQQSIEAVIRQRMAKPVPSDYDQGYLDALMWVIDLCDFSKLDIQ